LSYGLSDGKGARAILQLRNLQVWKMLSDTVGSILDLEDDIAVEDELCIDRLWNWLVFADIDAVFKQRLELIQ
jgi:hypothetical protein